MNGKHVLATNITSPTDPAAYMKKLTLNIDDLGLSPAVNEAVCHLAELRRIQSTSLMSLGELPHETLARLHASDCDIGLHLDLTGFAARQYPAVGGTLKQTLARAWLRRFEPTALRDLIRRQFDRFEDLTGHAPAFIDGHQHVHQFPQIRETLLQEAAARYPARPALRSTRPFARDHKSTSTRRAARTSARMATANTKPPPGARARPAATTSTTGNTATTSALAQARTANRRATA